MRVQLSAILARLRSSVHSKSPFPRVFVVLIVLLAGCGVAPTFPHVLFPEVAQPAQLPSSSPEALPSLAFPVGHFRDVDMPNLLTLDISSDGHYMFFLDFRLVDSGVLLFAGAQVRIDSIRCQAQLYKPALYGWIDDEGDLTFRPVTSDPCPGRRWLFQEQYEPSPYLAVLIGGGD